MTAVRDQATLRIGLAAVPNHSRFEDRLATVERTLDEAGERDVAVACFPEAYLPGLRGMDFPVPAANQRRQAEALASIQAAAQRCRVAAVIGMEWERGDSLYNVAVVVSREGTLLGYQTKNQIPPQEEPYYAPGRGRSLFSVDGVPFGIAICHEAWRYPETVRWAAARGASVVFHPQLTGSDTEGLTPRRWGDPDAPYYEKAMLMRGIENTIYFASVNCAMQRQESATTLIGPNGACLAHVPYGKAMLLVRDLDLRAASGFYAKRLDPSLHAPMP
jgi:predicted amidohydrolase